MSTTTTPKPSSSLLSRFPKNKRRLFFILVAVVALLFAANSIGKAYHRYTLIHQDMMQAQILFSQYREYIDNRLNYNENVKLAQLEEAWTLSEAKISRQQETIKRLEQALAQKSHHSEKNLLQELKAHKEMYIESQQKLQLYEQHLLALTQELKSYREINQLIKQEQAKMRAEHQELIKKLSQTTPSQVSHEALEKALDSRLSQFVYADYELEQKLKDLQKAVESSAKVGELKALEVYYDDKINDLSSIMKNGGKRALPQAQGQAERESEVSQLKQELIKLRMEKEEMKTAVNNLWNQQRKSEERLNKLVETQASQNNKPSVQEQPQPAGVNNGPKNTQKEASQKAPVKEPQELIDDFFKQFGVQANAEQQQNHFNQRRANPSLNNLNPNHLGFVNRHPGMGHFNHDPFHPFSSFPRSNVFSPRQRHLNHGMMEDFMFW